jgi:hypothetical protein
VASFDSLKKLTKHYVNRLFFMLRIVLALGMSGILRRAEAVYEFPVFMSITFVVFILAQCTSLMRIPGEASGEAVDGILLTTLLCAAVCVFGFPRRIRKWLYQSSVTPLSDVRLRRSGVVFLIIAAISFNLMSKVSDADAGGSTWTGKMTI